MKRSYRNILNNVARQHVPDEISLFPRIATQLERKPFMQTLHARPAISIIILIFVLSLLSGVVYAVGHSLGYIPGVGIVEQDTPIRMLIQPSASEQDGITLTVTNAVLTSEKTIVLYTLENIPWDTLSRQEDVPGCFEMPFLRLPNGNTLISNEGGGSPNQMRIVYPPIPAGVNEVTFVLPCIMNSLPGLAPENWELPLQFGPASPDMTIIPVVEITPILTPEVLIEQEVPVELNNALLIGDQYILTGSIKQPEAGGHIELIDIQVTEANGEQVYTQMPGLHDLPSFDWGMQFQSEVQFPLTLAFDWIHIVPVANSMVEFEFDAGENPQPGQEWTLNRNIQIGGRAITLETVRTGSGDSYSFIFSVDPDITGLSLEIPGTTSLGGGGGGYGLGQFSVSQSFAELPKGKLTVILSDLLVATPPETWSLQWSFENPPMIEGSEPASAPEACLTLAKWTQLIEQNDLPTPVVQGRIITTVNEGGPLPAIYVSGLDGTSSQKAAIGAWPSLSNDGTRLAYSAVDGLHVLDLSTGQNTYFGTDGYRIIWSPDDTRLMFTTTFNIYVVNADGSGLEKINTESSQVISPVGWLPDNQGIIYSILAGAGFDLKQYNWQNGETESLFTIHNKAGYGAISPDGQWIVFADRVVDEAANWSIFIALLDGSERKLIAEPEVPTSFTTVWGPDGRWLIINTTPTYGTLIPVLVNPFSCQAAVLQVNEAVEGWSR
jgi:hypothetical protein